MKQEKLATPRRCAAAIATVLLAYGAQAAAAGRQSVTDLMKSMAGVADYLETAISPNHRFVAWVQAATNGDSVSVGAALYLQPADRSAPTAQISANPFGSGAARETINENSIAWSPDSSSLAFLSDAGSPGQAQLYVVRVADHAIRRLTQVKGNIAAPQWSGDGGRIAILFTENSGRQAGPLVAVAAPVGVVDAQVYEQRLMIIDAASGAAKVVSSKDRYVYEYDWSPHADQIVATAAYGAGDDNWYVAELITIDLATAAEHVLLKPQMQIAVPRWSPDGRTIAFIGGLMSDESIASGDIYEISSAGGVARNVTPALTGSAFSLAWRANSSDILFTEAIDGANGVAELGGKSGAIKMLWQGQETIRSSRDLAFGVSMAADGKTSAVIRESVDEPPGVWSGEIGKWKPLTQQPATPVRWGKAESIHWKSDEFSVQGWLVAPADVDPKRKYPLVVWIHGGPAWVNHPIWPAPMSDNVGPLLASQGYYVFFPNPRGSAGSGERFKNANVKDFGGGDLRDILAGIREVVDTRPIDDERVGIAGWSYGGYMSMWAITQTPRFRAAVIGAGISNWQSYYGENGIDGWMVPYFGASVYDDPAVYAKSSPMNFIKQVRTPALLVVGDSDVECPSPQSYEYWHALKTFGVKTQLVVYPHEGHAFSDPVHARDVVQRMVDWFDENMPVSPIR